MIKSIDRHFSLGKKMDEYRCCLCIAAVDTKSLVLIYYHNNTINSLLYLVPKTLKNK